MNKVTEIAKLIDHSILNPRFTDDDLIRECLTAMKYHTASVCVKPYAVRQAAEILKGSDVLTGCVVGFPHGNSTMTSKVFETIEACKNGAVEIDMVVNIGKVLSQDWIYVETEIRGITEMAHNNNAIVKVIFETDFVTHDADKIKLCQICSRSKADFVKTSTGFGYVKGNDGNFFYVGATEHDIILMREHSTPEVKIKASGGIRNLDEVLKFRELGAERIGTTSTIAIIEEALKRFS